MTAPYEPLRSSDDPPPSDPAQYSDEHTRRKFPAKTLTTTGFSPSRAFLAASALLVLAFSCFRAGQWYLRTQSPQPSLGNTVPHEELDRIPSGANMSGKYNVGYFSNWGIYGRKYPPSLIPAEDLTHILYAFANVRPDSGEVYLSDKWADEEIHYEGDSWSDVGTNLYGNFKQLYLLKKRHRHLKLLLSIGGWSYSPSFHPMIVSPAHRTRFVHSAIRILEDYGLDGLDIDYEYPGNDEQARGYVELLRELRYALDEHASRKGANYRFLLTIAAPCGPSHFEKLYVRDMDQVLDFWNLMAYDYAGSWDSASGHQANIYGGALNTQKAIDFFTSRGVPRHKLIIGIPLYGRSFMNTAGPGAPFSGVGPGSWEQGTYDYRALPLPGSTVYHDDSLVASWSYDPRKKELISFDTDRIGWMKGQWITREGLGGGMYWELSGDKGPERHGMEGGEGKIQVPGRSLIRTVKEAMGGLDTTPNWLWYEGSKFENMRRCME